MEKNEYVKCPRCDMNYMQKSQNYCDVCRAELKLDASLPYLYDDEDEEFLEPCPVCKVNFIGYEEDMCQQCRDEQAYVKDITDDVDKDEEWRSYLDDDKENIISEEEAQLLSLSKLAEEEEEEEEEEEFSEDETFPLKDDFDVIDNYDYDYEEDEDEDEEFDEDEDED